MRIEYLGDHPEWLPIAANWLSDALSVGRDAARYALEERRNTTALPLTLLAVEGEKPVGMASLLNDIAPEPWRPIVCLAGLYVDPAARGRGVGAALCRRAVDEARHLGLAELHLYTPDKEVFYGRLGWRKVADTVRSDPAGLHLVTFMSLTF